MGRGAGGGRGCRQRPLSRLVVVTIGGTEIGRARRRHACLLKVVVIHRQRHGFPQIFILTIGVAQALAGIGW